MGLGTRQSAILFLDRDRFDLYVNGMDHVFSFPFSETTINSMDVVNTSILETQIGAFVEQNNIRLANIMIILSPNLIFEKDIEVAEVEKRDIEMEKFQETVPFERLYTLSFPLLQGTRILAVNKALCDSIKNSFEKLGFLVDSIVPYVALGPDANNITALDPQTSQQIIKRWDSLGHNGFSIEKNIVTPASNPSEEHAPGTAKNLNIRLYIMIGAFIFLLLILFFLIFLR